MNLYIFGFINNDMVNYAVNEILNCDDDDDTIVVYINSEGGEGHCDYAIYEALKLSDKKIITHVINEASSSAIIVYLAGDIRYATNYSKFMVHEPYFTADPTTASSHKLNIKGYRYNIKDLEEYMDEYYSLIAKRTKLTVAKIKKMVKSAPNEDWYFNVKDAMQYGFTHKIGFPKVKTAKKIVTKNDNENNPEENVVEIEYE